MSSLEERIAFLEKQIKDLQKTVKTLIEKSATLDELTITFINLLDEDKHTAHVFCECINTPLAKSTQKALVIFYKRGDIHFPTIQPMEGPEKELFRYFETLSKYYRNGELLDEIHEAIDLIVKDYAHSNRERLLLMGCVRFVTVPQLNQTIVRHSLLISGETVDHKLGNHCFVRKRNEAAMKINGLYIPGQGAEAATDWLLREGYLPPVETRISGAGITMTRLQGESASLSLALALISLTTKWKIPGKWIPSAGLIKKENVWRLTAVEDYDIKWRTMPKGCTMILSEDLKKNDPSWEGCSAKNVVFCNSLDAVVRNIWPDFKSFQEVHQNITINGKSMKKRNKGLFLISLSISILIGLIILETGLIGEWALYSIHLKDFPGWFSKASYIAILRCFMAGLLVGIGNWIFMAFIERSLPLASPLKLAFITFFIWFFLSILAWSLIPIKGELNFEKFIRSGHLEVFKVLMDGGFGMIFLIWPSWNALVWATFLAKSRRYYFLSNINEGTGQFPGVALIFSNTRIASVILSSIVIILTYFQWEEWGNYLEAGFGYTIIKWHIIIQILLLILGCWAGWIMLRYSERIQATELEFISQGKNI